MLHFLKAARLSSVVHVQISMSQKKPKKARVYFLAVLRGGSQHAAARRLLLLHSLLPLPEAGEAAGTPQLAAAATSRWQWLSVPFEGPSQPPEKLSCQLEHGVSFGEAERRHWAAGGIG